MVGFLVKALGSMGAVLSFVVGFLLLHLGSASR